MDNYRCTVTFTPWQWFGIKHAARKADISGAEFVRRCVIEKLPEWNGPKETVKARRPADKG